MLRAFSSELSCAELSESEPRGRTTISANGDDELMRSTRPPHSVYTYRSVLVLA